MSSTKYIKSSFFLILGISTVFVYQNCGQVDVRDLASERVEAERLAPKYTSVKIGEDLAAPQLF